ncbi:hypothetical protein [Bradyrhizobium sp. DASA03120]|uniref:hypothetical protein n=1 Tax=Bradyrhizobium sp. SMVTL-02 TaxID=3395917 RepID=UPI003F700751
MTSVEPGQRATWASGGRLFSSRFLQRLVREPLAHFLLAGAILFAVYAYAGKSPGATERSRQIALSIEDLSQLVLVFRSQWRRDPTADEMRLLIEDKVQEEVLYREALALGIDKDDTIVRRRMAQKMQFLAEDVAAAREPAQEELATWYATNRERFALPPRLSFRHLYFSPDRRANRARADAAAALVGLTQEPEDSRLLPGLAMPLCSRSIIAIVRRSFWPRSSVPVSPLPPRNCRQDRGRGPSSRDSVGICCSSTR